MCTITVTCSRDKFCKTWIVDSINIAAQEVMEVMIDASYLLHEHPVGFRVTTQTTKALEQWCTYTQTVHSLIVENLQDNLWTLTITR